MRLSMCAPREDDLFECDLASAIILSSKFCQMDDRKVAGNTKYLNVFVIDSLSRHSRLHQIDWMCK